MIKKLKKIPPKFKKLLSTVSEVSCDFGYNIYLVGGVVRDLLLERKVFDLDIVVEGNAIKLAESLSENLKSNFMRHHSFGTATVSWKGHKIDFATARTEKYSHWGALPKVNPASLSKDLLRRDFTINSLAVSLNKDDYGRLIDPYGGVADLKKGLIRVLHSGSFLEDPTRILRAIRFEQRFGFKIEPETFSLMRQAIEKKALNWVNPHRLRDELILILKEPEPCRYIQRVNKYSGFHFLYPRLKLDRGDSKLCKRIEETLRYYIKNNRLPRAPQSWLIYLGAILKGLPSKTIEKILHDFAFKKGERIIVTSIRQGLLKAKRLKVSASPKAVYCFLNQYSLETILFFYTYYPQNRLHKNIEYFLAELIHSRTQLQGRDLKELGIEPATLYGRILKNLLYAKITKGLKTKNQEIKEAHSIFKRLTRIK